MTDSTSTPSKSKTIASNRSVVLRLVFRDQPVPFCVLIAMGCLYAFGSGPVKGFAVTLLAGIAASMITSIFVVKTFFLVWLNRNRSAEALSI